MASPSYFPFLSDELQGAVLEAAKEALNPGIGRSIEMTSTVDCAYEDARLYLRPQLERVYFGEVFTDTVEKSRAMLQDAIAALPSQEITGMRALLGASCEFLEPQDDECALQLDRAVALNPLNVPGLFAQGARAIMKPEGGLEMWKTAMHAFSEVLAVQPSNSEAALGLALLQVEMQQLDEASMLLRHAATLRPTSRGVIDVAAAHLQNLGGKHAALGRKLLQKAKRDGVWQHLDHRPVQVYYPTFAPEVFPKHWQLKLVQEAFTNHWLELEEEARVWLQHHSDEFWTGVHLWPCPAPQVCENKRTSLLKPKQMYHGFWAEAYIFSCDVMHSTLPRAHEPNTTRRCPEEMPKTCALIARLTGSPAGQYPRCPGQAGGLRIARAGFSLVTGPRTVIPRHRSPDQGRARMHCAIRVPGSAESILVFPETNASVQHRQGECFFFEESFPHEVHYTGPTSEPRVVHPLLITKGRLVAIM
eukprot:gnl/MRDRNA2_/MRDRNA2_49186_c0_seq1.p1 gnl/MRDRNA2_/MRDRNA2_49186_c0~~gnl/MRDRNA2_/MRDRNA2_49186_c0_seq1.p1  ORF type:complete len:512 (+),score=79.31 gnl/MRDRNA2_/MRDRNA2_49186_c0_seq1:114-1538(+)